MELTMPAVLLSSAAMGLATTLGASRFLALWDQVALARVDELAVSMRALGIGARWVVVGMRLWGLAMVATIIVMWRIFDLGILVVPTLYLVYHSPRWILGAVVERRRKLLRDQIVWVCTALANTARSGLSLAQGLAIACKDAPRPLADELAVVVNEFHHGRPLLEAIQATTDRLDLDTLRLFTAALVSCTERGGRYTEALENIGHSLQENQRLEGERDSVTVGGRIQAALRAAFPIGFGGSTCLLSADAV
ncbi:MAG: type II secretion system F family protein, partial [Isosphaeraceae bacterium]